MQSSLATLVAVVNNTQTLGLSCDARGQCHVT